MNQDEKQLLLKDLCARLPYVPKGITQGVYTSFETGKYPIDRIVEFTLADAYYLTQRECVPIYFPLTCLQQWITIGDDSFVPIRILYDNRPTKVGYDAFQKLFESKWENWPSFAIELLQEWHINFRLPDHLFVPVTETFNPYK
jgi:hypothetical protein